MFDSIAIIFCIVALVLGMIQIIRSKAESEKKENLKKEKDWRIQWAKELKQEAKNVADICTRNKQTNKMPVAITYEADLQMSKIINELTMMAELKGKVDAMADSISEEGRKLL